MSPDAPAAPGGSRPRVHPQHDVKVAQSPVRMADVDARARRRLVDDLVQAPADGVVLDDVAEHLPVDLVVALRVDEAEVLADHVVPHGEQVRALAGAELGGSDPWVRVLDVRGRQCMLQGVMQSSHGQELIGVGHRQVRVEREILLAQQTKQVAAFAVTARAAGGPRPVALQR